MPQSNDEKRRASEKPTASSGQSASDDSVKTTPPGLDAAKHAKAQRAAQGAELLREGIFPALMASALGLDSFVETPAFRVFLQRLMADLGNPQDPIEKMLAEQLALAHFRIAQLHIGAGQAKSQEAVKLYNTVCARMLGEFRRSCLALRALRAPPTAETKSPKVRLFKMAK